MAAPTKLRIGFIPEHFSTPLNFAITHHNLAATLIPVPTGTGDLTKFLKSSEIDVAVGLTEGFIADLGKSKAEGKEGGFKLVGTYVQSKLRWGISTGGTREDVTGVEGLKGKKVGVSRIGSGSYVMSYVLADQQGWLKPGEKPFEIVPKGKFDALRKGVSGDKTADFFMWEHFTTKRYWDSGELKRIGEIYTPWPSWMIAARSGVDDKAVGDMLEKINEGVKYYLEHKEESIEHITSTMEYSKEDVEEWMKTVEFSNDVKGVDPAVADKTISVLRKAGVLDEHAGNGADMLMSK
ncbi:hypothetical protein B0A48_00599 [Cryoendolithus antarcticus]|uniref:Ca3427-like PBP 2 domain-containing protein n=1 Tax=Cryoendolithus antarcticus TaxID=1507870 RepID=A0A1V8TV58_9PEZI|nr:hypothetical protein B0A48_00599 [Cryoendolithus antarcticus]